MRSNLYLKSGYVQVNIFFQWTNPIVRWIKSSPEPELVRASHSFRRWLPVRRRNPEVDEDSTGYGRPVCGSVRNGKRKLIRQLPDRE